MKILYNGSIIDENEFNDSFNRGFQFGDGLFETIIATRSGIRYFEDHFQRLMEGMKIIGLRENENFSSERINAGIAELITINKLEVGRIKLLVWRSEDKTPGYAGINSRFNYVIKSFETQVPAFKIKDRLSLAKDVRLSKSISSQFKTISALPYVLASRERINRQIDDLVLTDYKGNVSECCSANIYWIVKDQLYSSPLSTGCVRGIMRTQIENKIGFIEKLIPYEELLTADSIISSNVARIHAFTEIDGRRLTTNHPIIEKIKQLLEPL